MDSLQETVHRNVVQHKSPCKKNDGSSKHKVQSIALVHILVYGAIKMKDGAEGEGAEIS